MTIRNRPLEKWLFQEVLLLVVFIRIITIIRVFVKMSSDFKNYKKEVIDIVDVKEKMADFGMTQVDMILELQKRGYAVQPPMLSSILRGVYTYPKAKKILAMCEEILKERENE